MEYQSIASQVKLGTSVAPLNRFCKNQNGFCPLIIPQNGDFQCTDLQGSDDIRKLGTTHDAVVHDESGRDKKADSLVKPQIYKKKELSTVEPHLVNTP